MKAFAELKEQPGEGIWSFAKRVHRAADNFCIDLDETMIVQGFLFGLKNKVVALITKFQKPGTLSQAIKIAEEATEIMVYEKQPHNTKCKTLS